MCHIVSCDFTHMHMYTMAVCYIQYGGCSGVDIIVGLEDRGVSSLHVLTPPTLVRKKFWYCKNFIINNHNPSQKINIQNWSVLFKYQFFFVRLVKTG